MDDVRRAWARIRHVACVTTSRNYDYLLGGKNNFEADRAAADEIMQLVPEARIEAISNRKFLRLAVRYLMT